MRTELFLETSGNLYILTLLSARENFIAFCHRESFKVEIHFIYVLTQHPEGRLQREHELHTM